MQGVKGHYLKITFKSNKQNTVMCIKKKYTSKKTDKDYDILLFKNSAFLSA